MSTRVLGYVAIAEALSFVGLLVAMVFKYGADEPTGVTVLGPIHGALFVAYVGTALIVRQHRGWGVVRTMGILAAGVLPIAGYVVGHRLLKEERVGA